MTTTLVTHTQTGRVLGVRDQHGTLFRPEDAIVGWAGAVGPLPSQYGQWHVYARDVGSGSGNCVCARPPGHRLHVEIAPGVPVPDWMRQ